MTTTDTPQAPSADTPESVAARVENALETCASHPSIAADATGLLSNFIGCVEKGRGSALDAGDGRAARFALDLLVRRDRAQAAEIARLSERLEEVSDARFDLAGRGKTDRCGGIVSAEAWKWCFRGLFWSGWRLFPRPQAPGAAIQADSGMIMPLSAAWADGSGYRRRQSA